MHPARTLLLTLVTTAIVLVPVSAAQAHIPHFGLPDGPQGADRVHNPAVTRGGPGRYNQQLRVGSTSRYGDAVRHAIRVWSAVRGAVFISAAQGTADVVFEDIPNRCDDDKATAKYNESFNRPAIKMNVCSLDARTPAARNAIAAHELGHALGLPHLGDVSQTSTRLMAIDQVGEVPGGGPQRVDIRHYRQAWGRSRGQHGSLDPKDPAA